jgi:predicted nuclease of predicted toxin-antitoxin system
MGIGVTVILIAIGITTVMQQPPKAESTQIIVVGPIWSTDSWTCTSDSDFVVHGALRGLAGSLIEINITNIGSQSLFALEEGRLESFTVGAEASNYITITRTGTLTGFITMETSPEATASCTPI